MKRPIPFLWFDGCAEAAARFYLATFPGSRLRGITRAGPGRRAPVMSVQLTLRGQDFIALNGGPQYHFTPAISFLVECGDQAELDSLWRRLTRGGAPGRCGWLTDRFGVSWQVVPRGLGRLLQHPAAMKAMLGMGKLDLATLRRAAAG